LQNGFVKNVAQKHLENEVSKGFFKVFFVDLALFYCV